ncbi:MAG: PilT/PilU family type 4a pilus ATPase [Micrococcales bacterium]|nr:PilT/PilU family type 4a pilus ATPase [Micrococcales bacterium]MCL2666466.1 PilT/PilU family type 4a pilus ATPase [Micrococcales bacterium]
MSNQYSPSSRKSSEPGGQGLPDGFRPQRQPSARPPAPGQAAAPSGRLTPPPAPAAPEPNAPETPPQRWVQPPPGPHQGAEPTQFTVPSPSQPPTQAQPAYPPAASVNPAQQPHPSSGPPAAASQRGGTDIRDRLGNFTQVREDDLDINAAMAEMVQMEASDLHLTVGSPPMVRVSGHLQPLERFGVLAAEPLRRVLYAIVTQAQREKFEAELELDFSMTVRDVGRFRVNLYQQREAVGAAFRLIPYGIKPLSQLGMPKSVAAFASLPRGLVLVTGPTGSGKSTTLAAIIDLANETRDDHIITVEDPIEFLHHHKKCLVNQREVGTDTWSFANALKHSLREDPDIILVGELRDLETMSVALTAAETGHLVFATLHTQDAAQTIDRFVDVFPGDQQAQVRTQLSAALQGVVCQTLCRRANGAGRVVATEVMVATPAIRNMVREGKTHQIYSAMQAGSEMGMHTMDQALADLVRTGKITYETGLEKAHHVDDFNKLTGREVRMLQGASSMQDVGGGRLGGH